jgi:hypothetical protein
MPVFPFSVELEEADGSKVVIGTVASPGLAWACYYAAVRAYPSDQIMLCEFGTVLAQSRISSIGCAPY